MPLLLLATLTATWADAPALLTEAIAPVDAELRACMTKPHAIGVIATRRKDGSTSVTMPIHGLGIRGYTPEERCLMKVVATIALPPLPADIAELTFAIPVDASQARWDAWRDLTKSLVDREALVGCVPRGRTVRVVLDLRKDATRAWLPAWQFKADRTPRACLAKALRASPLPALPRGVGLQLSITH